MTTTHRRGAAAVIALIILSLTGLTATAYTRADLAASSSDADAVAGWRALYAAESGVACAIAWRAPAPSPLVPPQISATLDPQITGVGLSVVRVTGASVQAHRHIDAQLRRLLVPRTLVQQWSIVTTTAPMPGVSQDDSAIAAPEADNPIANPGKDKGKGKDKDTPKDSPDDHDNGKGNDDKSVPGKGNDTDKNAPKDSPDDHDNGKGNDDKSVPGKAKDKGKGAL